MSRPIEDYGLLGNTRTAALVTVDGSIDWMCVPRFDSPACFASLLGDWRHGYWRLAPAGAIRTMWREYRPASLVLETRIECDAGEVKLIDCMPIGGDHTDVVRRVEGVRGDVVMRCECVARFDYGSTVPWVRSEGRRVHLLAGPDHLVLDSDVELDAADGDPTAEFRVSAGDQVDFRLCWMAPEDPPPEHIQVDEQIEHTTRWWQEWAGRCGYDGDYQEVVTRSLITLKALTYAPSGGIVAAPTTSVPEQLGGVRNWDYRYCWIRDATFTLMALLDAGYRDEAVAWREWLVRATAGQPEQMQIMYGVWGERRMPELELEWLPGYVDSTPVRIGNAAAKQFQLDVYGELSDALHQARASGIPPDLDAWRVQSALMDFLESHWQDPDTGIWEMRGPPQHYTYSKVMAWTAADRAVKAVEDFDLDGPVDRWKRLRKEIFDEVCEKGYDSDLGAFTQYYGSKSLDTALLLIPNVGFLPATDERTIGTTMAIDRDLCDEGLFKRYPTSVESPDIDALPPGEAAFLPSTLLLAGSHALEGNQTRAIELFERVLALRNDLGLLAEEYDTQSACLVGNYPQALSHILVVDAAFDLVYRKGPMHRRADPSIADSRRSAGTLAANSPR